MLGAENDVLRAKNSALLQDNEKLRDVNTFRCEENVKLSAENKDLRTKNREIYLQYSYALDKIDALRAELEQAKLYKTMYHELVSSVLRAKG
jgi:hypothetical protein